MPTVEERVLAAIKMDDLLAFLGQMVAFQSLGGNESPIQRFLAEYMQNLDMEVDVWDLDLATLSQHPAFSTEIDRTEGLGIVGTMGNGEGKSLIFNGHVDVVPAGDLANWHTPAWQATIVDGKVYGRGALDMKGGLACAIFAAKAIRDAGVTLKGKLMIESVIGEEDGGVGALATVVRGYKADAAVIMEPTELMISPAQAGALNFRITVPGLAAHGAVRAEGVNPIDKFIPIYQALMAFETERSRFAMSPYSTHSLCASVVKSAFAFAFSAATSPASAATAVPFVQRRIHASQTLHSAASAEPAANHLCQFGG